MLRNGHEGGFFRRVLHFLLPWLRKPAASERIGRNLPAAVAVAASSAPAAATPAAAPATEPMITDSEFARAVRVAAKWAASPRSSPANWLSAIASLGIATLDDPVRIVRAIEVWQIENKLAVDGIAGPITIASILRQQPPLLHGYEAIVCDGKRISADGLRVVDWREPGGLSFYDHGGFRARRSDSLPHLVVWHWDVSASSRSCYQTLIDRGLSIHFMVDADGTIYQSLDAVAAEAWHARPTNRWSVGIEINNPVEPHRAGDRPIETVKVHGQALRAAAFYPTQISAIVGLACVLSDALKIPRVLPAGDGPGGVADTVDPRVASGEFRGHVGHLHVDTKKWDPATSLWPHFRSGGFGVA